MTLHLQLAGLRYVSAQENVRIAAAAAVGYVKLARASSPSLSGLQSS